MKIGLKIGLGSILVILIGLFIKGPSMSCPPLIGWCYGDPPCMIYGQVTTVNADLYKNGSLIIQSPNLTFVSNISSPQVFRVVAKIPTGKIFLGWRVTNTPTGGGVNLPVNSPKDTTFILNGACGKLYKSVVTAIIGDPAPTGE